MTASYVHPDPEPIVSRFLLACVLATAAVAAPVPKLSGKVDPGKPWDFPDLDSKGWVEQKSGLKIWEVKEGEGDEVKTGATVQAKYTGWLTDGKKFDGGEEKPALSLPLNAVIKGWQEGMIGMKPGGIRRLVIPADLGYGPRGQGPIPANATLVFVIEYVGPGK